MGLASGRDMGTVALGGLKLDLESWDNGFHVCLFIEVGKRCLDPKGVLSPLVLSGVLALDLSPRQCGVVSSTNSLLFTLPHCPFTFPPHCHPLLSCCPPFHSIME